MTRRAHMIEFACSVVIFTRYARHRLSCRPALSLSYMLIFTTEFLCAFDCHRCSRDLNHIKSCVESARQPTTSYCRRDDWDFSLVSWRTWMTLNCCIRFANAARPPSPLQWLLRHVPFYLFIASCILCMAKKTQTRNFTCGWNCKLLRTNLRYFAICLEFCFSKLSNSSSMRSPASRLSCSTFVVFVVFAHFSSFFFPIELFDWNCEARPLFNLWCTFHIFFRDRNSNNRFHGFFIETKMIRIHKLHMVGHWAQ